MARRRKRPGSGCVIERPSAQHGTVFQIRWRVNGGAARYETIGPDRADAEQALALKLAEIDRGTYQERRDSSFREFAEGWFADKAARLKPSTVEDYRIALECHLLPFFADYRVAQIGPELIERYIGEKIEERRQGDARVAGLEQELEARRSAGLATRSVQRRLYEAKRDRGLSNRSINKTLTRLRQVMESAVKFGLIAANPVRLVERTKVGKKVKPFLELDQIEPLLEATAERDRALVSTMLLAGLRIGEALALRWGDVALLGDPPRLTVRRTLYKGQEGPVKTGEEGTVTFGRQLLDLMLDHKEQSCFNGDGELVFCTSKGKHLNPSNVRRRVLAPAVGKANQGLALADRPQIPADLTPHRLRDTYCSLLIAQGEDVATVAAQMRHADPTTTLRIYTHVMKHRRQGVAERLDQAIWGDSGRKSVANAADQTPLGADGADQTRSTMRIERA